MYRPAQPRFPSGSSVRSGRRGGTNVDPAENGGQPMRYDDDENGVFLEDEDEDGEDEGVSYATPGRETRRSPRPEEDEYFETMTRGPTSVWTGGTT
jgi:hypothetical protein